MNMIKFQPLTLQSEQLFIGLRTLPHIVFYVFLNLGKFILCHLLHKSEDYIPDEILLH